MQDLLPYGHPLVGAVALLLAFLVFRDGFAQRKQRLRRTPAPEGSRKRHVKLGPWVMLSMGAATFGGMGTAVFVRHFKLLDTFHGWLGLVTTLAFIVLWRLGLQLVPQGGPRANVHGLLGLFALFAAGLTGVLGISLLP